MAEHWRAFDRAWFQRWQPLWLALLDEPLLGRIVRWLLCIRASDVGYRGRIIAILPHAYLVEHADGSFTADVRTHPKFAKRVYEVGKPIWWALHAWDWAVADRWAPAWSFGFSTLTAYPDPGSGSTTVDGIVVRNGVDESWAAIRSGAGTVKDESGTTWYACAFAASGTSNQWQSMRRSIFTFDTSALGSTASVSAAVLSLFGVSKIDNLGVSPDVDVYAATPASNNALTAADYSQIGSTSQTGSPVSYAGWSTAAYNAFTFNATGRSNVSLTGISKFGTRNANYDVANVAPTWSATSESLLENYHADQVGTTNDPKLEITYTLTGGTAKARASWMASVVLGGAM